MYVFIVQIAPQTQQTVHIHPWYWKTLFFDVFFSGANSEHYLQVEPNVTILPGNHYSYVNCSSLE